MDCVLVVQPTLALRREHFRVHFDAYSNRDCTGVLLKLSVWYFDSKTLAKNNSHSNISSSLSKITVS